MFQCIDDELAKLDDSEIATFWWRDDDAYEQHDVLTEIVDLSEQLKIPLSLAVVPHQLSSSIHDSVRGDLVNILLHGYSHKNYNTQERLRSELSVDRDVADIVSDLKSGKTLLSDSFGEAFLPILVPPWGNIRPDLYPALLELGIYGVSLVEPRRRESVWPGIQQINAHVDLIDWSEGSSFIGAKIVEERIAAHLMAKRSGIVSSSEPTGILTHHRAHDSELRDYLPRLLQFLTEHPKIEWVAPAWR